MLSRLDGPARQWGQLFYQQQHLCLGDPEQFKEEYKREATAAEPPLVVDSKATLTPLPSFEDHAATRL